MRGGPLTGMQFVCNGCFTDGIYYSAEGPGGRIDYCFTCTEARLPNAETYARTDLLDHLEKAKKRQYEKDFPA